MPDEKVEKVEDKKVAEDKKDTTKVDATSDVDDTLKSVLDAAMKKLDAACAKMDAWDEEKKEDSKKKKDSVKKDEDFKKWAEEEEKEPEHKEDKAKKDAEEDTEAMRLAADKKKADAEEEEKKEMEEKKDAARADAIKDMSAQLADQRKTIEELMKLVRQPIPDSDRAGLAAVQSRADSALMELGEGQAPQPLVGESVKNYRLRMASRLQQFSDKWSKIKLDSLQDEAFSIAETDVYADAAQAARKPTNIKAGYMREITKRLPSGHMETTFAGADDAHFVTAFTRPARRMRSISYTR